MRSIRGYRKGVSVQIYRFGKSHVIRLEYHLKEEQQCVFYSDELMSSFVIPPSQIGNHSFRIVEISEEGSNHILEYRVQFLAEPESNRIRYEIDRRFCYGDDTKWYWLDRNTEPGDWSNLIATTDKVEEERDSEVGDTEDISDESDDLSIPPTSYHFSCYDLEQEEYEVDPIPCVDSECTPENLLEILKTLSASSLKESLVSQLELNSSNLTILSFVQAVLENTGVWIEGEDS